VKRALTTMTTTAGAAALASLLAGAGDARGHAFPGGAPPGVTGGFGEPTCVQCHSGSGLNAPGGSLEVDGLPARYTPGETYRLIVRLRRADVAAAGFQLSARTAGGAQAGTLSSPGRHTQVQADRGGVQYAGHAEAGSDPTAPGVAEWSVGWTAPASGAGEVRFHAAANAANGDRSPWGDHVYTAARSLPPR
jgi:hypothetical protein